MSSGREQMRKGFEEMEKYDKQSYRPERLDVSCHGRQGFHDEPWSLVANDLMKQNILIAAYDNPITVVEISKTLGIPTAYVETAVNDLLKSELMAKSGNKVFTDFMITTPEQLHRGLDVEIDLVERNYDALLKLVNEYLDELGSLPLVNSLSECKQKKLKYYFILHLFLLLIVLLIYFDRCMYDITLLRLFLFYNILFWLLYLLRLRELVLVRQI